MSDAEKISEIRAGIDSIDSQIRNLLMKRLDCSCEIAKAKLASGETTVYRPDREKEILERLGAEVPAERRAEYLAVVRKILETSRMYQYGILYDLMPGIFEKISEGLEIPESASYVRIRLSMPDRSNSMPLILSMIEAYGYEPEKMEIRWDLTGSGTSDSGAEEDKPGNPESGVPGTDLLTIDLTIQGDLNEEHMRKLMYRLSKESAVFRITDVW